MFYQLSQRRKAVVAALGVAVTLLYQYNVVHPNVYVSAVLAALTVLGVHATTNAP